MGQFLASRFAPPPSTDPEAVNNPEATWWCKLLARVIGTIGGFIAFISAIFVCLTISPLCIVSGLLLMLGSVVVLVFEAPICCSFIELTKPIAAFAERRTFFQKAIIYVIIAIIPLALCFGLSALIGCGLIFAAGVFYGLMGLGRKADRQQMMATAAGGEIPRGSTKPDDTRVGLIDDSEQNQFVGQQ